MNNYEKEIKYIDETKSEYEKIKDIIGISREAKSFIEMKQEFQELSRQAESREKTVPLSGLDILRRVREEEADRERNPNGTPELDEYAARLSEETRNCPGDRG